MGRIYKGELIRGIGINDYIEGIRKQTLNEENIMSYYTSAQYKNYQMLERKMALKNDAEKVLQFIQMVLMAPVNVLKSTSMFFIRWALAIIFWSALIAIPVALFAHFGLIALFLL